MLCWGCLRVLPGILVGWAVFPDGFGVNSPKRSLVMGLIAYGRVAAGKELDFQRTGMAAKKRRMHNPDSLDQKSLLFLEKRLRRLFLRMLMAKEKARKRVLMIL